MGKLCLFRQWLLILVLLGIFLTGGCGTPPEEEQPLEQPPETEPEEEEPPEAPLSPYTGLPAETVLFRPFALMIDNHRSARPQLGLQEATLVYEILAEGDITRFLAIFHHHVQGDLGPVRSVRPYYAHLARENDAILAHCGASVHALKLLASSNYHAIDERPNPRFFHRDSSRPAPHNLFTNMDKLQEAAEAFHYDRKTQKPPPFIFEEPLPTGNITKVTIPYTKSSPVIYTWDNTVGGYRRSIKDQPHTAGSDPEQITVTNIIVQYVPSHFISSVHREFDLVGEGQGLAVRDGHAFPLRWEKQDLDSPTRFYLEDGTPLALAPGNTWIHLLSPSTEVLTE